VKLETVISESLVAAEPALSNTNFDIFGDGTGGREGEKREGDGEKEGDEMRRRTGGNGMGGKGV